MSETLENQGTPETVETQPEVSAERPYDNCPHCGGTGLTDRATAGNAAKNVCRECDGSGRLYK